MTVLCTVRSAAGKERGLLTSSQTRAALSSMVGTHLGASNDASKADVYPGADSSYQRDRTTAHRTRADAPTHQQGAAGQVKRQRREGPARGPIAIPPLAEVAGERALLPGSRLRSDRFIRTPADAIVAQESMPRYGRDEMSVAARSNRSAVVTAFAPSRRHRPRFGPPTLSWPTDRAISSNVNCSCGSEPDLACRHHPHSDDGGLALPSSRHGRLQQNSPAGRWAITCKSCSPHPPCTLAVQQLRPKARMIHHYGRSVQCALQDYRTVLSAAGVTELRSLVDCYDRAPKASSMP